MEESKRRAYIKQQATRKKKEGKLPPKATGQANPSTNAGEIPAKLLAKPGLGVGKGLMKGPVLVTEECPVLLREDSSYVLKQISSIIKDDDYSDLGNHATEAMGEMDLFSLTKVCIPIVFLCSVILLSFSNLSVSCKGWS